jgi:hypothetical protein
MPISALRELPGACGRDHWRFPVTTRRQADGVPLPVFVEQELCDFLTSGILAHGFARLRCTGRTHVSAVTPY